MNRPSRNTLIRYFRGKSLPHEIELVDLYLAMDIEQDYVASCLQEAWAGVTAEDAQSFDKGDLKALKVRFQLEKTAFEEPQTLASQTAKQPYRISAWMKAAVAAILLIGASALFVYHASLQPAGHRLAGQMEDILPGSDRALLTLADGSTISLSDAANGKLTEQAGLQIEKKAEGELVYTSDNAADKAVHALNSVVTPNGGQYRVILPDGSKVWLNAASSITYPVHFQDNERRVKMTGEVYFEIAKVTDKQKKRIPFFVETDKQEIQVLGTHFNVNAYPDEHAVRTTLVEGSVLINAHTGQSALLKPGQQALLTGDLKVSKADLQQQLGWKNGDFIFRGERLDHVLRQIARWYDVEVEYPGHLADIRFTGMVSRSQPLSMIKEMIETTKKLKVTLKERRFIVTD